MRNNNEVKLVFCIRVSYLYMKYVCQEGRNGLS